jgi:hypothetical protein
VVDMYLNNVPRENQNAEKQQRQRGPRRSASGHAAENLSTTTIYGQEIDVVDA